MRYCNKIVYFFLEEYHFLICEHSFSFLLFMCLYLKMIELQMFKLLQILQLQYTVLFKIWLLW